MQSRTLGAHALFETSNTFDEFNALKNQKIVRSIIYIYCGPQLHPQAGKILGSILYKNLTLRDPEHIINPFEDGAGLRLRQHYADLLKIKLEVQPLKIKMSIKWTS